MKGLRFESRGEGDYYKLILHIGQSFVPVSDDILETLKQHSADTPDRFLPIFLDQVGYSTYLREMIQAELNEGGDSASQLSALQQFLKELS
jgi:hypothetical protein